jgi:hypothetical protein
MIEYPDQTGDCKSMNKLSVPNKRKKTIRKYDNNLGKFSEL